MGRDKALLEMGGQTLLARVMALAMQVAEPVRISGSRERYGRYGSVVEDIYPGCGPLAGIQASLRSSASELNLVLPVDVPLLSAEFLRWLLQQAHTATEWIVVPEIAGGLQPLCAVYRSQVSQAAEAALKAGRYKIGELFREVPTRVLTEDVIRREGFSPELFRNVNTMEEFTTLPAATFPAMTVASKDSER